MSVVSLPSNSAAPAAGGDEEDDVIRNFLDELGAVIEAGGIADVEDDVAVVVAAARAHGMGGVALEVLADPSAPEVARWRALSRITGPLVELARARGRDQVGSALDAAVS